MTKILCTIWSLGLNLFGINIFNICFANSVVDDDGDQLLTGPELSMHLFTCGVYIIIVNIELFPSSFRKSTPPVSCLYEFLATTFLLAFSVACIWTPIDVLIMKTLPAVFCHILCEYKYEEASEWIEKNQWLMINLTIGLSFGFLICSLHVTRAVELFDIVEYGALEFFNQAMSKLGNRLLSELPKIGGDSQDCRCAVRTKSYSRKNRRSKTRRRSSS